MRALLIHTNIQHFFKHLHESIDTILPVTNNGDKKCFSGEKLAFTVTIKDLEALWALGLMLINDYSSSFHTYCFFLPLSSSVLCCKHPPSSNIAFYTAQLQVGSVCPSMPEVHFEKCPGIRDEMSSECE